MMNDKRFRVLIFRENARRYCEFIWILSFGIKLTYIRKAVTKLFGCFDSKYQRFLGFRVCQIFLCEGYP